MIAILNAAAVHWDLPGLRPRPDVAIPGSPERCLLRLIVEADGDLFLLERIAPQAAERRRFLALTLEKLAARGTPCIAPPRRGREDAHLLDLDGTWQLTPYVPGVELARPEYVFEEGKGERLGFFLAALAERGADLGQAAPFSLTAYVDDLLARLRRGRPALAARLGPVRTFLTDFLAGCDHLPRRFCHGDFHPMNVVWGPEGPRAVIDWEFAGLRPALWDAALCAGCVGVEAPPGLVRGLVPAMLGVLRDRGWLEAAGRESLLELVLAQRFAWLAEWLRRQDRDMIGLELDYMELLMTNAGALRRAWDAA